MVKESCFAYREVGKGIPKCNALSVMECDNCKFYKTVEEYEKKVAPLERKG